MYAYTARFTWTVVRPVPTSTSSGLGCTMCSGASERGLTSTALPTPHSSAKLPNTSTLPRMRTPFTLKPYLSKPPITASPSMRSSIGESCSSVGPAGGGAGAASEVAVEEEEEAARAAPPL